MTNSEETLNAKPGRLPQWQPGLQGRSTSRHSEGGRRRIETELQYPSTIKITVIRESRFTETAT